MDLGGYFHMLFDSESQAVSSTRTLLSTHVDRSVEFRSRQPALVFVRIAVNKRYICH